LDGRTPDLVFEKINDTFAARHRVRIWQRPGTFGGKQIFVWAANANRSAARHVQRDWRPTEDRRRDGRLKFLGSLLLYN
jgi:hypothetical protein